MQERNWEDEFDWRGCTVVQWDPLMLGGLANVNGTRSFADAVLNNYDDGMSIEEITSEYQLDLPDVQEIIAFALSQRLKAIA